MVRGVLFGWAMVSSRLLVSFASLALVLVSHGAAEACSAAFCASGGQFLPSNGAVVPASVPGILFDPLHSHYETFEPSQATVTLFRVEAGVQAPVDITTQIVGGLVLITPVLPLEPNSNYALEGSQLCASDLTRATFHTGATAPLPTTLGTLTASTLSVGAFAVAAYGSCHTNITAAKVRVDLALSAESVPWLGALSFRTLVDGNPWHYSRELFEEPALGGAMSDHAYALCEKSSLVPQSLEEGTHMVWMEATLPGSTLVLKTDPISVTLSCAPPSGTGGGGAGTGGGETDTGGGGGSTGGTGGGTGGSTDGDGDPNGSAGGCSVGGGANDGAWAASALAALAALGRRRRSRERAHPARP